MTSRFISRMILTFALWAFAWTPASADEPACQATTASHQAIAITHVTVVPMAGPEVRLLDQTVVVSGGRIVAMGPASDILPPVEACVVDGRGRFLTPGLMDMHVHLEHLDDPRILELFLGFGVTTVRSMDGRPYILEWRDAVTAGRLVGPRIVTSGPILDGDPPQRPDNLALGDPVAARTEAVRQIDAGYDFLKVYGGLSREAYEAILEAAADRSIPVAGHVPESVGWTRAVETLWSVEHLSDLADQILAPDDTRAWWMTALLAGDLDEQAVRALSGSLAASGAWIVPTLVERDRAVADRESILAWAAEPETQIVGAEGLDYWTGSGLRTADRLDAVDLSAVAQARQTRRRVVGLLHASGVRLVAGTDTPNPFVVPGAATHLELQALVEAGLSPSEALAAATVRAAEMNGWGDAGRIEPGARADLLLLADDPLENIRATQELVGVMAAGRWWDRAGLERLRAPLAP